MRMRKIQSLSREAKFDKDPWLSTFGINVDMRMVDLEGRVLPPPKLQYGGNRVSVFFILSLFPPTFLPVSGRYGHAPRRRVALRWSKVLPASQRERIRIVGGRTPQGRSTRLVSTTFSSFWLRVAIFFFQAIHQQVDQMLQRIRHAHSRVARSSGSRSTSGRRGTRLEQDDSRDRNGRQRLRVDHLHLASEEQPILLQVLFCFRLFASNEF